MMKAAVINAYGGPEVVEIAQVPVPAVGVDDVLVRTRATTVNSGDWRVRSLSVPRGFGAVMRLMYGVSGPKKLVLGTEAAGVVEQVGKNVSKFKPGDEVVVMTGMSMGAHAEFCVVRGDGNIVHAPKNVPLEEAAAMTFGGTTALSYLRTKGRLAAGEKVLVVGASGTVGLAAVQIAKYCGAVVTAVCSARNAELVKSLGADSVIDYHQDDPFKKNLYDVIFDAVGTSDFYTRLAALKENGRLLLVVADIPDMFRALWASLTSNKSAIAGVADESVDDMLLLKELMESGKFKAVIDSTFSFNTISGAHAVVDTGHKRGSVVVTISSS
eukprot:CAMPEP_0185838716 /NCGR_PEP_ID=MMETSP1353-20130828/13491_1 /TAXON_ID=1077150 /ORGANISM="Erythrolobus australicus, Strain CCMP3124" /LENGTH=326 /DNA_ID=CAMNT_0028537805 /DNA_START=130 /DNA_END=1110 /DNA_ORIENTATION=+